MLAKLPEKIDALEYLLQHSVAGDLRVLIPIGFGISVAFLFYALRGKERPVAAWLEYSAPILWVIIFIALLLKTISISGTGSFDILVTIRYVALIMLVWAAWQFANRIFGVRLPKPKFERTPVAEKESATLSLEASHSPDSHAKASLNPLQPINPNEPTAELW